MRIGIASIAAPLMALALLKASSAFAQAQTIAAGANLSEATIAELQIEMTAGRLTSARLVEHFLARIAAVDRSGPTLNSVIEINPEALAIANRLDEERRTSGPRGPLHGIPVLLKDNIDTADAMLTTAGSLALAGSRPSQDAFIVTRLRAAGALILGKTNLSEWANFRSTRSSSGWSGRGGQTKNAYAPDRNPCGSSSGSGVAIAAGLAVVAVGTETDGSIVCPSAVNGLVGIKPTIGLVSRSGIIPISASQDTAGPMARNIADAAALLTVIMGADANDSASAALKNRTIENFAATMRADGLKGVRIGVARDLSGFHEGVDVVLEQAIASLVAAGAVIVDPANLELSETLSDDEFTTLLYEFKDGLNRYLATRPDAPQSLAQLIAFNEREREREMPYFGQELFLQAEAKGPLTEKNYRRARERARKAAGRDGIDAALAKYRLDVIIAPSYGPAWTTDLVNGDRVLGGSSQASAVAGYPHVTVPAGMVHNLPVGISFIGPAWSDARLIGYAYAFENASRARRPPAH